MKTLLPAMSTKLAGPAVQVAMLLTITRRDAVVVHLTDYDRPVPFGGVTYSPQAGLQRTALSLSEGLAVDHMDISGYFDTPLTEDDLRKGKFDAADVVLAFVEASNPDGYGQIPMFAGYVGDIIFERNRFTLSINGFTELLQQSFGELTSPDCRANFGDSRCKINQALYTFTGTVVSVVDRRNITVSVSQPAGKFNYGTLTFTNGLNAGVVLEVKNSSPGAIETFLPAPYTVAVGNAISLVAGCDKKSATCTAYNNIANFRGEPHLPGITPLAESASRLI